MDIGLRTSNVMITRDRLAGSKPLERRDALASDVQPFACGPARLTTMPLLLLSVLSCVQ